MQVHEPEWTENRAKSDAKIIIFQCRYTDPNTGEECRKTQPVIRSLYENGKAFPSLSPHS